MNTFLKDPMVVLSLVNLLLILLIALAGWLRIKWLATVASDLQSVFSRLGVQTRTASPALSSSQSVNGAGILGSRSPMTLPAWNQLNDPLPNGLQDSFATSDCGEECCAEVIYGTRGVIVSAGALRFMLGGAMRIGLTNASDLVELFARNNIQATARVGNIDGIWPMLATASAEKRPVILLGTWLGGSALHWVVVTTVDADVIHFNDPWGGVRRKLTRDQARPLFDDLAVEVLEPVKYGLGPNMA